MLITAELHQEMQPKLFAITNWFLTLWIRDRLSMKLGISWKWYQNTLTLIPDWTTRFGKLWTKAISAVRRGLIGIGEIYDLREISFSSSERSTKAYQSLSIHKSLIQLDLGMSEWIRMIATFGRVCHPFSERNWFRQICPPPLTCCAASRPWLCSELGKSKDKLRHYYYRYQLIRLADTTQKRYHVLGLTSYSPHQIHVPCFLFFYFFSFRGKTRTASETDSV